MPRPKKNKNATAGGHLVALSDARVNNQGPGSSQPSAFAVKSAIASRTDLFDDHDGENDNLGTEVELKVNDAFATKLEYNKNRQELQRLEAKYGKNVALNSEDDSDYDSENDVTEDEIGFDMDEAVDEDIKTILSAIKSKDPQIYKLDKTWYKGDGSPAEEGEDAGATEVKVEKKKEKSMTLKEYHVQNLLNADKEEDDPMEQQDEKSYQAEVDEAKRAFMEAANTGSGDDASDDDLITEKARHKVSSSKTKSTKAPKPTEEDVEKADKNPERFLDHYLASQGWVGEEDEEEDDPWAAIQSDSETEERLADTFEEAYNLRFEDPDKSNEMLRTHSRTVTALKSVRREDNLSKRQKARLREKEARQEAGLKAKEDRARLRKLKIQETEHKLNVIKEAAGAMGREFDIRAWVKFLEGDYSDEEWNKMMEKEFGDEYYDQKDDGMKGDEKDVDADADADADIGATKPVWDDDIDIGDLVDDDEEVDQDDKSDLVVSAGETTVQDEAVDGADSDGDIMVDIVEGDDAPRPKASTKAEKAARKAAARAERRHVEAIVDSRIATDHMFAETGEDTEMTDDINSGAASSKANRRSAAVASYFLSSSANTAPMPSQKAGLGKFKYRQTEAESFGLSPLDILTATDEQLNQFSGLKRYAAFRDPKQRARDKKALSKHRLKEWRSEVFGSKEGVTEEEFSKVMEGKVEVGALLRWKDMMAKREVRESRKKKRKGKSAGGDSEAGQKRKREADGEDDSVVGGSGDKGDGATVKEKPVSVKKMESVKEPVRPTAHSVPGAGGDDASEKKKRKRKRTKTTDTQA